MSTEDIGGIGSGWLFEDPRGDEQIGIDGEAVRRQIAAVFGAESRERVLEIIERLSARQQAAAPPDRRVPFERYGGRDGDRFVLVARGQLVVRAGAAGGRRGVGEVLSAAAPDVVGTLRQRGFEPVSDEPGTRLFRGAGDKNARELADEIQRLRESNIEADMNLVVPLGYLIKGDDLPSPTTVRAGYRPPHSSPGPLAPVRVAVVDTGIAVQNRTDEWLDNVVRVDQNIDPLDIVEPLGRMDWFAGHGTFAAGIVQQVAPHCEIVVYRFTGSDGIGTEQEAAASMVRAAADAQRDKVRLIINASLGTPAFADTPPLALQDAVQLIRDRYPEVLIVASAGNLGTDERVYPAALDGVVAVGALQVNRAGELVPAEFSSHGDWVDCSTVGAGVVSPFVQGTLPPEPDPAFPNDLPFPADAWAVWTGTSFSAPQISGAVARICQTDPALTPRAALGRLLAGKPTIPGYGKAIQLLRGTPVS